MVWLPNVGRPDSGVFCALSAEVVTTSNGKCKSLANVAAQKEACAPEYPHSFLTLGEVAVQLQANAQEKA